MKTKAELHAQREMDEEITRFVREMSPSAPVTWKSVASYLQRMRRRLVTDQDVMDRLFYLTDKGFLKRESRWEPGEGHIAFYQATAKGRDALDGAIPWE